MRSGYVEEPSAGGAEVLDFDVSHFSLHEKALRVAGPHPHMRMINSNFLSSRNLE